MTSNAPNGRQVKLLQLYSGGRIIYRLPNTVNLCTRSQNAYVRGAGVLCKSFLFLFFMETRQEQIERSYTVVVTAIHSTKGIAEY